MDLVLRNGWILDGTGRAAFRGDVGIKGGFIVAVGAVAEAGIEEINADDAVIAPGFIDVHTHYDAQIFWDPTVSPSLFHGVTTVIGGNCGFTLAPLSGDPEDADYLLRMLSKVEGMPLATLRAAVQPDWKSFGEYLDRIDGTLAINTIFLVGHSAVRRAVMGSRAVGEEASDEDIEAMAALLSRSLEEGGAGFSTTVSATHSDYEGQPVPSRWATREEILHLARVVRDHPGTWCEMVFGNTLMSDRDFALAADVSLAARRTLNWNLASPDVARLAEFQSQQEVSDYARERGASVVGLVPAVSPKVILNFISGFVIDTIPGWMDLLVLPENEKTAALADAAVRSRLVEGAKRITHPGIQRMFADWGELVIESIGSAERQGLVGSKLRDHAESVGKEPLIALLDLAVAERLAVSFSPPPGGEDDASWQLRAEAWRDDRFIIGGSDAGAHLDMINTFAFSTQLLGEGVRRRNLLPLEEAVHRITKLPANRFGIRGRGELAAGMAADIVIFDPDTIDCGPVAMRNDLPDNGMRLYADAIGVSHVIVNGTVVVSAGQTTGKLGGRVLRSGKDTVTVPLAEPVS